MTTPLRPDDPRRLGSYYLLARLGQGGMGTVYLAHDARGRTVAVKVIRPEFAALPEFRARFRSEVKRARQVPPFCTAEVLEADPDHPNPYLVVEYVDGASLQEVVSTQGPLSPGNLHSVAIGIATALVAIHSAGVVHRDLKPANVLFSLGNPKVIDFGIARALEGTSEHTRSGHMVGTVAYMAPERFDTDRRQTAGPAADIFAWGVIVAYAATGRTPFAAESPVATAARILTQPPDLDGLPGPLGKLVARALSKDPERRPRARELLEELLSGTDTATELDKRPELRRAIHGVQLTPTRIDLYARPARLRPRDRWSQALAVAAVLLVGAVAVLNIGPILARARAAAGTGESAATSFTLSDSLRGDGAWVDPDLTEAKGCEVDPELGLVVRLGDRDVHHCVGDRTPYRNPVLSVDMQPSPSACASIMFSNTDYGTYQIMVCKDSIRIATDIAGNTKSVTSTTPGYGDSGSLHHVKISVNSPYLDVTVDGNDAFHAEIRRPVIGQGSAVTLGATEDTPPGGNPSDASVMYTGLEIWEP